MFGRYKNLGDYMQYYTNGIPKPICLCGFRQKSPAQAGDLGGG